MPRAPVTHRWPSSGPQSHGRGAHRFRPSEELTWTALGVLGGGIVLALVGVIIDATAAPRELMLRPLAWISPAGALVGLQLPL